MTYVQGHGCATGQSKATSAMLSFHLIQYSHSVPVYSNMRPNSKRLPGDPVTPDAGAYSYLIKDQEITANKCAFWICHIYRCLQAAWSYVLGQIGDAVDVMPGEEFRVALQEAAKVQNHSLCDC